MGNYSTMAIYRDESRGVCRIEGNDSHAKMIRMIAGASASDSLDMATLIRLAH